MDMAYNSQALNKIMIILFPENLQVEMLKFKLDKRRFIIPILK